MENVSDFPKRQRKSLATRRNLEKLRLELSKINGEVQCFAPWKGINGNWGVPRYGIGEVHGPAVGSIAEAVPDPLLKSFISNVSAPKSCDVHLGEGFCSNTSNISNAKGYDPLSLCTL